ncbi:GLPGLI family protein [Dyadobacter aurulentus]|uniref:GLPGLI family protein n=1 Tax=Dyadobacter sp. UC 10 TaxID=2605428 RepID=UPI0011F30276|nr:GLPGLI family protein [Dyadobacter sp. UC 10]KAA0993523.1 GLPGLI family protein [Dyadobacter sp. UC 10]
MIRFACVAMLMLACRFTMGQDKAFAPVSYDITCIFQLTFFPDSTSAVSKTESFFLFIKQEQSLFKSKNRYLQDSAISAADAAENRRNLMSFLRQHPTDFDFSIVKHGCNVTHTVDRIYHNYFSYTEVPGHLQWVLTQDTATVSGYPAQRATTEFGGRIWEAWFTETVPVSEGPYKFCGLPGLIVRLADSKKQYEFVLDGLKQSRRDVYDQTPKTVKTDKRTFFKKQQEYRANPIGVAEQSGVVFTSGRSEIVQRVQQKQKSNNNPIEFFTN